MVESELFTKGLETRRQVLGAKYVDANLAGSDDFMMTFQHAVTELAWGYAWSRPGLDQKTRSILTLGILAGLGRFQELGIYTNAAVASGVTVDEIKEALVQITVYCGTPAGRQAFLAAHEALGPVDSKDSLLSANQIQGFFWGGNLGCDGSFGFERRGLGADGAPDYRSA
jgi:4-carboxymuconolactone decarboxylase